MSKTLLPNARFLSLPSDRLGQDWFEKSSVIDGLLEKLGFDLADEVVYLIYDRAPGSVLHGEGSCHIARSIIGPKKELDAPLLLTDWVQAPVYKGELRGSDWAALLDECYGQWEIFQKQGLKLKNTFMVLAKRRLFPELGLTLEVVFIEG